MSRPAGSGADGRPVTYAQASLYFAEQKAQAEGAYNLATRVDVQGRVADGQLAQACRRLTAATPALQLRMGIEPWTGEVTFRFASGEPDIEVVDCDGDDAAAEALIETMTRRALDVDDGPMTRYLVVRTGPERASAVLVAHHVIMDGFSNARIAERFARCLTGPVEPDSRQDYLDLVDWIRAAEAAALRADRDYWFERVPPDLVRSAALPRDGSAVTERATRRRLLIDAPAAAGMNALAESAGVSLFKVLMAAVHHALPPRGGSDSVLCAAASQRPAGGGYGDVVGCFVNMVPLVARRRAGDTVLDLLGREAPGWDRDVRRRHFPFVELAQHLDPQRRSASRVDSVMVGYRRAPRAVRLSGGGLSCTAGLNFRYPSAKTELSVRFFDYRDQLECEVQWSERLPDAAGEAFVADLAEAFPRCAERRSAR